MTRLSITPLLALLALPLFLQAASAETSASTAPTCRCRPNDTCWPDTKAWNELKQKLSGQLVKPSADLDVCVKDSNSKACAKVLKNIHNPFYNENNSGDTQSQGLMNAWMNHASNYAVLAKDADDVAAAVNFAREHHLRLVIKGTGHDYLGRSNAADSLLISTHNMREVTFDKAFIPEGCDAKTGEQALTVGAGTRWLEAYNVATNQNNRYVQGGGCTTVGAAGGFTQGGGFGSFSKNFGTGAAGILQVEVVTADGKILIANRCQNKDLFWAIRGGGASTFGVVTKMTLKTHALPSNFGIFQSTITAANDEAYKNLIAEFVSFYHSSLNNNHWGEQIVFNADNTIKLFLTFQDLSDVQVTYTFSPLRKWINQHKDLYTMTESTTAFPAAKMWDKDYLQKNIPGLLTMNKAADAGSNQFWWTTNSQEVSKYWYTYQSWWLPIALFEDSNKSKLVEALYQASRLAPTTLHINKGLSGAPEAVIKEVRNTATNPAVTDAAALVIMAAGSNQVYPGVKGKEPDEETAKSAANNITQAMSYFIKLAPNAGSYVNESDYFQKNWQQAFWGENYERLLSIKRKVDPEDLFICHHCVGSGVWDKDGMCKIS